MGRPRYSLWISQEAYMSSNAAAEKELLEAVAEQVASCVEDAVESLDGGVRLRAPGSSSDHFRAAAGDERNCHPLPPVARAS